MNVGLCTLSASDRPVEEVLELAAAAGYDGVEIWGRDHVGDGSAERCGRIVDAAADLGLEIPTYGSYLRCGADAFEEEVEREVTIADRLGADRIRVWAGRQEFGDHDEDHWTAVVTDLATVTERAGETGVEVTVEKHANTLTNDREGARRVIEAVDDERCRLNYQPGFALPADEIAREATEFASLSSQLHLQAKAEPDAESRSPLAEAYYDLEAVLEPFLERGFDGYANVEFVSGDHPYREAIAADLETIRAIVD